MKRLIIGVQPTSTTDELQAIKKCDICIEDSEIKTLLDFLKWLQVEEIIKSFYMFEVER